MFARVDSKLHVALPAVTQIHVINSSVVGGTMVPYANLTVGCCPPPRARAPSSSVTLALTFIGPSAEPSQHTKSREKLPHSKENSFLPG